MEAPDTLRDAIIWFADFEHCRDFMMELRWPDGIVKCPRCGSEKVFYIQKERVWKCYGKHDHAKFSLKTGTIFEDSPIALEKWLPAAWLIVGCKNGISSWELHRIRLAMHDGTFEKMSGYVEADETFIGQKARNMHKDVRARKITGTGGKDKTMVMGILERGKNGKTSKVRTTVVGNRKKKALQAEIRQHVEAGSAIYTDALKSYEGLSEFEHQVVDHAVEYAVGRVHTNGMENFWSLLKRALKGTYVSVEPFHLFRYLDEQTFRFNERRATDAERFTMVMKQIVGKRITYDQLTGKDASIQPQTLPLQ